MSTSRLSKKGLKFKPGYFVVVEGIFLASVRGLWVDKGREYNGVNNCSYKIYTFYYQCLFIYYFIVFMLMRCVNTRYQSIK